MRKNNSYWACFLGLIVLLIGINAGEAALVNLQGVYRKTLSEIDNETTQKIDEYRKNYEQRLAYLEKKYTSAGDLEGVLLIKKEKERFQKCREVPETALVDRPTYLRQLQVSFQRTIDTVPVSRSKRILTLAQQYDNALERLQVRLVKEGRIDDAVEIKAERDALRKRKEITAARFILADDSTRKNKEHKKSLSRAPAPAVMRKASASSIMREEVSLEREIVAGKMLKDKDESDALNDDLDFSAESAHQKKESGAADWKKEISDLLEKHGGEEGELAETLMQAFQEAEK